MFGLLRRSHFESGLGFADSLSHLVTASVWVSVLFMSPPYPHTAPQVLSNFGVMYTYHDTPITFLGDTLHYYADTAGLTMQLKFALVGAISKPWLDRFSPAFQVRRWEFSFNSLPLRFVMTTTTFNDWPQPTGCQSLLLL